MDVPNGLDNGSLTAGAKNVQLKASMIAGAAPNSRPATTNPTVGPTPMSRVVLGACSVGACSIGACSIGACSIGASSVGASLARARIARPPDAIVSMTATAAAATVSQANMTPETGV